MEIMEGGNTHDGYHTRMSITNALRVNRFHIVVVGEKSFFNGRNL